MKDSAYTYYVLGYQAGANEVSSSFEMFSSMSTAGQTAFLQGIYDGRTSALPKTNPQVIYLVHQAEEVGEPGTAKD